MRLCELIESRRTDSRGAARWQRTRSCYWWRSGCSSRTGDGCDEEARTHPSMPDEQCSGPAKQAAIATA